MTDQAHDTALRSAITMLVIWLVFFAVMLVIALEFRDTSMVELFGRTFTGPDALIVVGLSVSASVVFLALAIRRFQMYFQSRAKN